MYRWTQCVSLLFLLSRIACADTGQNIDPLFASDDLLHIAIFAPVSTIMEQRPIEEYVPGKLTYTESDGRIVEFDIGLRTRGRFRRQVETCRFAPLRLNFKKSQTTATIFDNQDKLKIITHCQNSNLRYQQSVVNEYLAYRVLNILTDFSFRVRLVNAKYIDSDNGNKEIENFAVLIEHKDRLAKRTDVPPHVASRITIQQLVPEHAALTGLFHYFIGNTDFSPIATGPGEDCCHNHELFGNDEGLLHSVPFDFDMSGFVDAPHSVPNPRFRLGSVRDRLYRGRCVHNEYLPDAVDAFLRNREAIDALLESDQNLTRTTRRSLTRFVDDFYKALDSPKDIQKKLVENCI